MSFNDIQVQLYNAVLFLLGACTLCCLDRRILREGGGVTQDLHRDSLLQVLGAHILGPNLSISPPEHSCCYHYHNQHNGTYAKCICILDYKIKTFL